MSRKDPYALVGTKFRERYLLESFVGIGRFSAVYRGTDTDTHHPAAIRLLKVRTTLTPSQRTVVVERLRTLVAAAQDVAARCPTFAGVLDVGAIITAEGRWMPGIVQSWLSGDTLEAVLEQERSRRAPQRTLERATEWMTPVADALSCAHAAGLVHGSLAARNILVRHETTVEVLDLGIASALTTIQGKDGAFGAPEEGPLSFFVPAYGSPEHFSSAPLGAAADVFSLALVMVELLTGHAPLGDGDDAQLEAAALDPVVRPTPRARGRDLGPSVEAVFERALAVRPADRHGTVESFWSALRAASRLTLRPRALSVPPQAVPPQAVPPQAPRATTPTRPDASVTRSVKRQSVALPPDAPSGVDRAPRSADAPSSALPTPRAPMASGRWEDDTAGDLDVGSVIAGKYSIERLLGRGGMGTVWLCTHLGLGERVAVKVMCPRMAADPEIRARFEREARASARIKSRYVARVHDTGELPDLRPYIVMEYMEGETLAQKLQGTEAMSLADTVRILGQVGRGLARAHELGIVHRDIKPDNVFLAHTAEDGVLAKVFDFGIVKIADAPNDGATREGVLVGTPHYMSPEQADGLAIDQRSDIYSLGVMAFRMLTGKRPFQGESILAILVKISAAPLPSLVGQAPWIPPAVDAWFRRACARDREQRFASAIECVDALASAAGIAATEPLRDVSILPPPPPPEAAPEPQEMSCPTLLDDVSGVVEDFDEDDGSWHDATEHRAPLETNPLFGGDRASVLPGRAAPPRSRGRRARRALALLGIVATGALLAVTLAPKLPQIASGDQTSGGAASLAPQPELPPAPPPTTLSGVVRPAPGDPSLASDAGPPATPPHGGRTRRAASVPPR